MWGRRGREWVRERRATTVVVMFHHNETQKRTAKGNAWKQNKGKQYGVNKLRENTREQKTKKHEQKHII